MNYRLIHRILPSLFLCQSLSLQPFKKERYAADSDGGFEATIPQH
jgi:hypothetical protein